MISGGAALAEFEGLRERIEVDTGETAVSYLLLGKRGSQVRVSASAHRLLALAAVHSSVEEITRELNAGVARSVSEQDVDRKLQELLQKLRDAEARAAGGELPSGYWLRVQLASSATVGRLCAGLSWAFHPAWAAVLISGTAASLAAFWAHGGGAVVNGVGSLWPAYGLFFLSLLLHELGHAAACFRYGAKPSEIGFTVYLVFPALYSDVSSAWRLRRWQREAVDLGGAYFQLVVGAAYGVAYLAGGGEIFRRALLMIVYTLLFSLNPIFKFDGYWAVADALGVTNLSRQPARIARRAWEVAVRRPGRPLPWPGWMVVVLGVYSVASLVVWGYCLARLAPWLVRQVGTLPGEVGGLASAVLRGEVGAALRRGQQVAMSAGMVAAGGMTLWGAVKGVVRKR